MKICGQVGGEMDNNYWFHIFLKAAMKNKEVLYKEYVQTGSIMESNVTKVWYIFVHGKIQKIFKMRTIKFCANNLIYAE